MNQNQKDKMPIPYWQLDKTIVLGLSQLNYSLLEEKLNLQRPFILEESIPKAIPSSEMQPPLNEGWHGQMDSQSYIHHFSAKAMEEFSNLGGRQEEFSNLGGCQAYSVTERAQDRTGCMLKWQNLPTPIRATCRCPESSTLVQSCWGVGGCGGGTPLNEHSQHQHLGVQLGLQLGLCSLHDS